MTRLEKIEETVAALSDDELRAFADWFAELQWSRWDLDIESDVGKGKLDKLADEAIRDFESGRTSEL